MKTYKLTYFTIKHGELCNGFSFIYEWFPIIVGVPLDVRSALNACVDDYDNHVILGTAKSDCIVAIVDIKEE